MSGKQSALRGSGLVHAEYVLGNEERYGPDRGRNTEDSKARRGVDDTGDMIPTA